MKLVCAQRGCSFEAQTEPEFCPVCNNPFIPHPDSAAAPKPAPAPQSVSKANWWE
jgi:hypothetical protein